VGCYCQRMGCLSSTRFTYESLVALFCLCIRAKRGALAGPSSAACGRVLDEAGRCPAIESDKLPGLGRSAALVSFFSLHLRRPAGRDTAGHALSRGQCGLSVGGLWS